MSRYTVFAIWRREVGPVLRAIEKIDVDAESREEARTLAERELTRGSEPGWQIFDIVGPRAGLSS